MKDNSQFQAENFIALVDHLHRNPFKITFKKVLKPILDNFLKSPDKLVLAKILTHVNFKQGDIKGIGEVLIKYNKVII
jgi:hypothetical protein